MKTDRIERVRENLFRDPVTKRFYGIKKQNGQRFTKSFETTNLSRARRALLKWEASLEAGNTSERDLRLDGLITRFLATRSDDTRTKANYESLAKRLRDTFPRGNGIQVSRIRTSDLLSWLTREANLSGWGGSYYNAARLFLRQMFDLAIADRILDEGQNPFKSRLIKTRRREKTIRRIPTLEQFGEIIESVRAQKTGTHFCNDSADFLEFLGLAGVGQAEAANLRWRDVGPESAADRQHIHCVRRKTKKPFSFPIYFWLRPLIERLSQARNGASNDDSVFKITDAKKALRNACKRLKLHSFTQRNLRAMCIKRLYDAGVPVKQIAIWQGHSDGGKLIQEVYSEVFCDSDAAAEKANIALVTKAAEKAKIVSFAA